MVDWSLYSHCYGDAMDVPEMLECIKSDDKEIREKGWFDFWGAMCHQESTYLATYAVFPTLVEMAETDDFELKRDCLSFVAFAEICRYMPGNPPIPDGLKEPYERSMELSCELALGLIEQADTDADIKIGLALIALSKGKIGLAHGIIEMEKEWQCEKCEHFQKSIPYGIWNGEV